jgi:hypothetical protein
MQYFIFGYNSEDLKCVNFSMVIFNHKEQKP